MGLFQRILTDGVSPAAIISGPGDIFIKTSIQQLDPMFGIKAVHDFTEALPPAIRDPLKYQGADFVGAYWVSALIGGSIAYGAEKMCRLFKPENSISRFLDKNYHHAKNVAGFGFLTGFEFIQANGMSFIGDNPNRTSVDVADIAAYGLGLTTFAYGPQIAQATGQALQELMFPTPQQKLERKLRV
jgi:hypothetical protein